MSMKEHVGFRTVGNVGKRRGPDKKGAEQDPYCWRFNKNNCKRQNCRYDHRCSYCGAEGHGAYNCRKKAQNEGTGDVTENETKPAGPAADKRK